MLCSASAGIFGALYCLADVHTEFSEVAKQLKEVAELLGQGLNRQLSGPLLHEYLVRATGGLEGGGGCLCLCIMQPGVRSQWRQETHT